MKEDPVYFHPSSLLPPPFFLSSWRPCCWTAASRNRKRRLCLTNRYFKAMKADIPYREYPPMNQARTLLLEQSSVMGQAFRSVAGFQVIYEDDLAIVYSHQSKEQP